MARAWPDGITAVRYEPVTAGGVKVLVVRVDLGHSSTRFDILLAHAAARANSARKTAGSEPFGTMVSRARAAAVINGTFFSKDAQKRVMGNMVREGQYVKFSEWESDGTAFGLLAGNQPAMGPVSPESARAWTARWLSLTAGPRLVAGGKVTVAPRAEGFADSHVLGRGYRSALGLSADRRILLLVSFAQAVTLAEEARAMQALGAHDAMNLDGGASRALAVGGKVVVPAGRELTNVLAVYDQTHPPPVRLEQAWRAFGRDPRTGMRAIEPGLGPGDRAVRHLRPGELLDFGGLRFGHAWRDPMVGRRGGVLTFSNRSYGQIYAPWQAPVPHYAVEFDAKVVDEFLEVFLDARSTGKGLQGQSLEFRSASPGGLYLRRNGALEEMNQGIFVDDQWHHFRIEVGGTLRVFVDGSTDPVLEAPRRQAGTGLGLAGRGAYRALRISPLDPPGTRWIPAGQRDSP